MLFTILIVGEIAPNTTLDAMVIVGSAFLILMLLLKKHTQGAIVNVLTRREEKITNGLGFAEQSCVVVAKIEKERQQQLFSFRSETAEITKSTKGSEGQTCQKTLEGTITEITYLHGKARVDISQEHEETLSSAKNEVADLPLQIATRILSKELTPDTYKILIDSHIKGLGRASETG